MSIHHYMKNHEFYGFNFGLRPKIKQIVGRIEWEYIEAGETRLVLDEDGPGIIDTLWFAVGGLNDTFINCILRIYVDNEVIPSIQFDCGSIGYRQMNAVSQQSHCATHFHFTQQPDGGGGFSTRFPIPYSTHIRITMYNPEATSAPFFCQTYRTLGIDIPLRLKSINLPWSNKATILASSPTEYEYFNLTGIEGWLVWFSTILDGAAGISFAESKMKIYIDGESSPSIESPDFPGFFGKCKNFSYSKQFLSNMHTYVNSWRLFPPAGFDVTFRVNIGLDIMKFLGGIYFQSGARAVLDTTAPTMVTDFDMSYIWLYYQKI
ncbi:MAG: DUF2961 domain-containing protein [bacterium]